MDYFTFLGIERVSCVAVYGKLESSRISSKNNLICFLKMNKGLTCLEQLDGE